MIGRTLFKITGLATIFIFIGWLLPPRHEWFHRLVTRALGGDGIIGDTAWGFGGYMEFTVVPSHHLWLVYWAGGLGIFFICMLAWIWPWRTKTRADTIFGFPLFLWAMSSLFYSFAELSLYFKPEVFEYLAGGILPGYIPGEAPPVGIPFRLWSGASAIGGIVGILVYGRKLIRWFKTRELIKWQEV